MGRLAGRQAPSSPAGRPIIDYCVSPFPRRITCLLLRLPPPHPPPPLSYFCVVSCAISLSMCGASHASLNSTPLYVVKCALMRPKFDLHGLIGIIAFRRFCLMNLLRFLLHRGATYYVGKCTGHGARVSSGSAHTMYVLCTNLGSQTRGSNFLCLSRGAWLARQAGRHTCRGNISQRMIKQGAGGGLPGRANSPAATTTTTPPCRLFCLSFLAAHMPTGWKV